MLASCGGGDDGSAATEPTGTTATTGPATGAAAKSYAETAALASVEQLPTEADEQPVLAWTPVDGAASYRRDVGVARR